MKKVLPILFCSVIFINLIIPFTSVYATEVTWGDNNNYYLTETEYNNVRQLAVLEIIPQLTSNGVNELSIDNAEDVDDFVDNFLNFIDNYAPDPNDIYNGYSTIIDIKNAIDETTNRIGQELKAIGYAIPQAAIDLYDWLDPMQNTPIQTKYYNDVSWLPKFQNLSRLDNNIPTPNPDINYISYINQANGHDAYQFFWYDLPNSSYSGNRTYNIYTSPGSNFSWFCYISNSWRQFNYASNGYQTSHFYNSASDGILTLYINYIDNSYIGTISNITSIPLANWTTYDFYQGYINYNSSGQYQKVVVSTGAESSIINNGSCTYSSSSLSDTLGYFTTRFKNINIYVNGNPWAIINDNSTSTINLNINGIDFYSDTSNEPITYYYPNGTNIDYQKLYFVIKRAIENNTPISQTIINEGDTYYYNNTTYSPTIYNYYGDDDEDEDDLISNLLTLAIVPEFDTALLAPIETPMLYGEKIMFTGVQAFPEEILFVLGGCFVLVLFGAMINRLIE